MGHVPPDRDGRRSVRSAAVLLATLLHEYFPSAPALHALGNHDTFPYYSQATTWLDVEAVSSRMVAEWRLDVDLISMST